jgi:hypothetical protein
VYLRLVITRRDEVSSRKQGIFTPAYALLDGGTLPEAEHEHLASVITWFERNLPPPDRSKLEPRSIFWFRPESGWLVRRVWELAEILGRHGFHVELLKTASPGRICYEDTFQVAATPFRNSRIG